MRTSETAKQLALYSWRAAIRRRCLIAVSVLTLSRLREPVLLGIRRARRLLVGPRNRRHGYGRLAQWLRQSLPTISRCCARKAHRTTPIEERPASDL